MLPCLYLIPPFFLDPLLTNWYQSLRIPQSTASIRCNLPLPTLEPHQIDHDYFTRFRKQSGAMDPNIQLLLDEIKSVKTAVNGVESRVGAVETSLGSRISAMDHSISDRFGRVEGAVQVFGDWRPSVDASVEELRSEVSTLRK